MLQSMGHKELDTTSQLNSKIYINKVDFEGKKKTLFSRVTDCEFI